MTSCTVKYTYDKPWPQDMMDYTMPFLTLALAAGVMVWVALLIVNEWKRKHTLTDVEELLRKHKADTE